MIIGLCGLARSGKDTFFRFCESLNFNQNPSIRLAFADQLKFELDDFLLKNFKISAFTENSFEKEIIRPTLVGYGMSKRKSSNGMYWVKKLETEIIKKEKTHNCFITDVRFPNEVDEIKKWGGICIHIERFGNPPANDEEKNEDPFVKAKSDFHFKWNDLYKENQDNIKQRISNILLQQNE